MGYTTTFKGVLKFKDESKASELALISQFLGEDIRDHDEWERNKWAEKLQYTIDLELIDDFSGLEWNGTEKSYEMIAQVNYLITQMRKKNPSFALEGKLLAQGEDIDDRWELRIGENGLAYEKKLKVTGRKIVCPHCEGEFILEGE